MLVLTMGIFLIVIGINMSRAQNKWDETTTNTIPIPGTKGRNAAIGAGVGAVGGGITAFVVGGIGIVVAGTGIGLPAGAGLIALATGLGAGAGAVAGAATGEGPSSQIINTTITRVAPAYETWQWIVVIAIGIILLCYSVYMMKHAKERSIEARP